MITCIFEDNGKGLLRHVVIDTLVIKDEKVLFVKRVKKLLEGGKWGLVGGFVDRDENLKQAVAREVYEETGYKVKDIALLAINDSLNRPHEDRQNISFVFFCNALGKEGKADWESDEQRWFPLSELPKEEEIAFDHYKDIKLYQQYMNKEISIPVLE